MVLSVSLGTVLKPVDRNYGDRHAGGVCSFLLTSVLACPLFLLLFIFKFYLILISAPHANILLPPVSLDRRIRRLANIVLRDYHSACLGVSAGGAHQEDGRTALCLSSRFPLKTPQGQVCSLSHPRTPGPHLMESYLVFTAFWGAGVEFKFLTSLCIT